jgi:large conductance mechanosensitive channel
MSMISEFKAFALKGNVVDMAVGVIIGGAFGAIVGSMVSDVLMPVIGIVTGGISFSEKFYALDGKHYETLAAAKTAGASVMQYGTFLDKIINFLIVAFCLFMAIKAMNAAKKKEAAAPAPAPAAPPRNEVLLEEIRDLLKKR